MSDPQAKFLESYNRLNPAQKEAVDAIEGPVMVVAGPGTGKTQILTLRVANILRLSDTAPGNILALTFTENAASNMRRRLSDLVGSRAYSVVISTFHGFCNDIIKKYPEEFPRIIGSTNITEVDQISIVEELIERLPLKILRPYGDRLLYTRAILAGINELKREGVTVEEFVALVDQEDKNFESIPDLRHDKGAHKGKIKSVYDKLRRDIDKNKELGLVYGAYEEELTSRKLYDYSDMIMEVLRELRTNETLLRSLQEEHQYILVDEHQDTNNAQNKILELIASFHNNPNLFVVGDEKQAIFRFQGASLENFYYFRDRYPEARLVTLEANYRSTQTILDHAHELLPGVVPLKAEGLKEGECIKVASAASTTVEHYFVVSSIKDILARGIPAQEIAVLYRDNRDALPLAAMFEKLGVPYIVESDEDLLSDPDIRKLLLLLRSINDFTDDHTLAQALHIDFLGISPLDTYRLIREASKERVAMLDLLQNSAQVEELTLTTPEALERFVTNLAVWKVASHNMSLLSFVERVVKDSGMLDYIIGSHDARRRLEIISSFFDDIASIVESNPEARLPEFLSYLDTVSKHNILVKKRRRVGEPGSVRLMTIHKSKGLEFEYVFIVGAYDGHIGGRTSRDKLKLLPAVYSLSGKPAEASDKDDEDERRLFYVALTRAKQCVTISYPMMNESGREQVPSQFISELKPQFLEYVDTKPFEEKLKDVRAVLLSPVSEKGSDLYDKEFIGRLFKEQGLSVTALNNYLLCPWQYFYCNLIRLPYVPQKHQLYGIAVHGALRDLFVAAKDRGLEKEHLLSSFERHLRKEPLPKRDFEETLERGLEALSGWFDAYHGSWNLNTLTEFKVGGVTLSPDIRLTGTLDKLEFEGGGSEVNVVDYKTGGPKSRNEIMGATRDSEGNYFRQLVFYKLLLDLYEGGKYKMVTGEIDFIEPNDRGNYKKEKFEISGSDISELRELIERVADEIINLKFWNTTCDDKNCEYCGLRRLMGSTR